MREGRGIVRRCAYLLGLVALGLLAMPGLALAAEPQTITFEQPPSPAKVGEGRVLTATASSGLDVELKIDPASTAQCSLSGPQSGASVKYVSVGTCVIDANQGGGEAGGKTYGPAEVQRLVAVEKGADTP